MDRQISWNNLPSSPVFGSDANIAYIDLTSEDSSEINTWASGGPTSSRHSLGEHGWTSSLTINENQGSRIEESRLISSDMHPMENINYNLSSNQVNGSLVNDGSSSLSGSSSRGEDVMGNSFHGRVLSRKRKGIDGISTGGSSSSIYQGESSSMHSLPSHQNASTALRIGPLVNLDASDYHNYSINGSGESSNRNCRVRIIPPNQWAPVNSQRPVNQESSNILVPFNQSNQNTPPLAQNINHFSVNVASSSRTSDSSISPNNTMGVPRNSSEHYVFSPPANVSHLNPTTRGQTLTHHQSLNHHMQAPQQVVGQPLIRSVRLGSNQSISVPQPSGSLNTTLHELSNQRAANVINGLQESYASLENIIMHDLSARESRRRIIAEHFRNALARRGELMHLEDLLLLNHAILQGRAAELHDRHRDMRLDVDNMSYEELLALEERIGNVSTGLDEGKIMKCLKQRKYISLIEETPTEVEPCCICQEIYVEEEDVGKLECGHDFHTACIKQWLMVKNSCPICKTTGLAS